MENESDYPRLGIFFDIIPIGELSLKRINSKESKCELGIILANDNYKGLGYGTEAVNLAIGYVFNVLRLKYI
ncbi:GNAT family N-acetyltransferase, partial [Vallitalea maricola]|uniref:GNAT family N-acetyltransferase n=1 Tax=Vallitalea maricola TaxID=3074433 RepID=UPI0030DC9A71